MSSNMCKLEKELCRCCHSEGSFTSLAEPSHDLPQAETFSEMLRRCFDIDICPVEGTYYTSTYTICEPCILQLRDASNFKQQVLLCEKRFRDMYMNDKALGDLNIEEEMKEEEEEEKQENNIQYELKEEYFLERSDDDAVAADDGNDDSPLHKQPRLETNEDNTDQIKPQKEMKEPGEINSSVALNKGTATDIKARDDKTIECYNLRKRNQTSKIVFTCNDSGKRFDNKRTLAVHIGSHEKLKQCNYLKCTECAYQTETQDSLERHSKLHDKNICFVCDICGYIAKKKYRLLNHFKLKNVHSDKMLRASNICESRTNDSNLKKHKQHLCFVCGYKCSDRTAYRRHLRIHTGEKPYSCSFCEYKFAQKAYLTRHLRIHTNEKRYSCSFCKYKCSENYSLTRHLRVHTGEKPYSCSVCDYKCASNARLTRHLRIHTGEKPYSCSFCAYKCARKCNLKIHLWIHTGEKPYSCSSCNFKCTVKTNLETHLRIHTGEKPYSCSSCDYKCSHKTALTKHIRIHTSEKPYSCSLCEYKCIQKSSLTSHLRIHTSKNTKTKNL